MKAVIAISDLHIGSTAGLCSPKVPLVDGGYYQPNKFQTTLYKYWRHFWREWVPLVTAGAEKRVVVVNGDIIDGVHHNTVNIISNDWHTQEQAGILTLQEVPQLCLVALDEWFVVRGTEVHTGQNGASEERIAEAIGCQKNEIGEFSTYQLWLEVSGLLFQFAHHIGTTSSAAYESSAPMREMIAGLVEAAQWGKKLPDVFVRSHRHRYIRVPIPTLKGDIQIVVTPAWQLRTPHVERVNRMQMPHIGGVVFLVGEDGECTLKRKMYKLPEPAPVKI